MTQRPGEHPEPPADLNTRKPLIRHLPAETRVFRIHRLNRAALFFGKTGDNRFDSPERNFGVLYAGMDEHCAFIETFGQSTGIQAVSAAMLAQRTLSAIELIEPLQLIDLSTSGSLARIGADMRLLSGSHAVSQRWSQALRKHPCKADGILYPARHDPARNACAIFERDAAAFRIFSRESLVAPENASLLADILECYQFGLIPEE